MTSRLQSFSRARSFVLAACTVTLSALTLTGCATSFVDTASPIVARGASLKGTAHGGQQPLAGANVYLFAAGTTGYGSASTSLLTPGATGVTTDAQGHGFVTTDAQGNWSVTGDYTCTPGSQLYILVTGGNPGVGGTANNTAIAMMTALGNCSSLNASTFVIINELTTVAAAEALQQFIVDGTHIGSSPTNSSGLSNAFLTALNMVGIAETQAYTTTPGGNGTVPQATLHTLANALAACVNTASSTSTTCGSLLASAPYNNAPAGDTLIAAVSIAQHPGYKPNTIFNLAASNPPFLPALTAAPNDFSIGITYALGGVPEPGFLAIDAAGNVWSTNRASEKAPYSTPDSILKLSPQGAMLGTYLSSSISQPEGIAVDLDGSSLWAVGGTSSVFRIHSDGTLYPNFPSYSSGYPQGVAIDTGGNAWVSNSQASTVTEIGANGYQVKSGITANGFSFPQGVAIDYNANIYVVGQGSSSILKLDASGAVINTPPGYTGAGLNAPSGIALDNSSRLWVANTNFSQTTGQQTAPSDLSVLTNTGNPVTGSAGYGNATAGVANIVAIDGNGSAWTAFCTLQCVGRQVPNIVMEISSTGTVISPAGGFQNSAFSAPQGIAIDASGNVWVANSGGQSNATPGSITQLVGVAAPVKTPAVAQLTGLNLVGVKP